MKHNGETIAMDGKDIPAILAVGTNVVSAKMYALQWTPPHFQVSYIPHDSCDMRQNRSIHTVCKLLLLVELHCQVRQLCM